MATKEELQAQADAEIEAASLNKSVNGVVGIIEEDYAQKKIDLVITNGTTRIWLHFCKKRSFSKYRWPIRYAYWCSQWYNYLEDAIAKLNLIIQSLSKSVW